MSIYDFQIPVMQITVTREGTGFSAKEWRAYLQAAYMEAGEAWHTVILPKHFTHRGATEYGYQERGKGSIRGYTKDGKERRWPSYNSRKFKKWGHTYPLVWSGKLQRDVTRIRKVQASSKGAEVRLTAPQYLYKYRTDQNQPKKALELRAISPADIQFLSTVIDKSLQKQIDASDRQISNVGQGHRRTT